MTWGSGLPDAVHRRDTDTPGPGSRIWSENLSRKIGPLKLLDECECEFAGDLNEFDEKARATANLRRESNVS